MTFVVSCVCGSYPVNTHGVVTAPHLQPKHKIKICPEMRQCIVASTVIKCFHSVTAAVRAKLSSIHRRLFQSPVIIIQFRSLSQLTEPGGLYTAAHTVAAHCDTCYDKSSTFGLFFSEWRGLLNPKSSRIDIFILYEYRCLPRPWDCLSGSFITLLQISFRERSWATKLRSSIRKNVVNLYRSTRLARRPHMNTLYTAVISKHTPEDTIHRHARRVWWLGKVIGRISLPRQNVSKVRHDHFTSARVEDGLISE